MDPLDLIQRKESGGQNVPNYKYGPGFSASGYFQIIDGTWRRWAQAAGIDVSRYPTAMSAPYEVQRQVAAHGYKTEGFKPWEAVKDQVGHEAAYGAPGLLSPTTLAASPVARAALAQYLGQGKSLEGVQGNLRDRLEVMVGAMPENLRQGFAINSTYRSPEQQQVLWDAALKKYGSAEVARKWVAPPGSSEHGRGNALDLGYGSPEARAWMHANAEKYGLKFPLNNEPWHIEAAETRGGSPFHGTWGDTPGVMAVNGTPPPPGAPPVPEAPKEDFVTGLQSVLNPTTTAPAPVAQPLQQQPLDMLSGPSTTEVQGAGDLMAGLLARRRGLYGGSWT